MRGSTLGVTLGMAVTSLVAASDGPSFDCAKASSSAEKAICADPDLAALDRKLHDVFTEALAKAKGGMAQVLKTEQRGWIKGRDECWKAKGGETACLRVEHRVRITELQARWSLVPARGPVAYVCQGNPSNEVVATWFESELRSVRVERGDRTVIAYLVDDAPGGARYEGPSLSLREADGGVRVTWLGEKLDCKPK